MVAFPRVWIWSLKGEYAHCSTFFGKKVCVISYEKIGTCVRTVISVICIKCSQFSRHDFVPKRRKCGKCSYFHRAKPIREGWRRQGGRSTSKASEYISVLRAIYLVAIYVVADLGRNRFEYCCRKIRPVLLLGIVALRNAKQDFLSFQGKGILSC